MKEEEEETVEGAQWEGWFQTASWNRRRPGVEGKSVGRVLDVRVVPNQSCLVPASGTLVRMELANHSHCARSFVMIKSDNTLIQWTCNVCHHGPFWFIWESSLHGQHLNWVLTVLQGSREGSQRVTPGEGVGTGIFHATHTSQVT